MNNVRAEKAHLAALGTNAWTLWWAVVTEQLGTVGSSQQLRDGAVVVEYRGDDRAHYRFVLVQKGRVSFHEGIPPTWDAWIRACEIELYRLLFLPECNPTLEVRGDRDLVLQWFDGLRRVELFESALELRCSK